jgi:hypothetical protein
VHHAADGNAWNQTIADRVGLIESA